MGTTGSLYFCKRCPFHLDVLSCIGYTTHETIVLQFAGHFEAQCPKQCSGLIFVIRNKQNVTVPHKLFRIYVFCVSTCYFLHIIQNNIVFCSSTHSTGQPLGLPGGGILRVKGQDFLCLAYDAVQHLLHPVHHLVQGPGLAAVLLGLSGIISHSGLVLQNVLQHSRDVGGCRPPSKVSRFFHLTISDGYVTLTAL